MTHRSHNLHEGPIRDRVRKRDYRAFCLISKSFLTNLQSLPFNSPVNTLGFLGKGSPVLLGVLAGPQWSLCDLWSIVWVFLICNKLQIILKCLYVDKISFIIEPSGKNLVISAGTFLCLLLLNKCNCLFQLFSLNFKFKFYLFILKS